MLDWYLRYGNDYAMYNRHVKNEQINPEYEPFEPLSEKTEVWDYLHWLLEAWWFLHHFRQQGMNGEQPLQLVDIDIYLRRKGTTNCTDERFMDIMYIVDAHYMQHIRNVQEQQRLEQAGKQRRGGRR